MEHLADTMATVVTYYRVPVFLGMLLNRMADITETGARFDQFNTFI